MFSRDKTNHREYLEFLRNKGKNSIISFLTVYNPVHFAHIAILG